MSASPLTLASCKAAVCSLNLDPELENHVIASLAAALREGLYIEITSETIDLYIEECICEALEDMIGRPFGP